MFWFILFLLVVYMLYQIGNGDDKEMVTAISTADEAFRFVEYCEIHVDELPDHVQARFNEMKERIDRHKENP